MSDETYIGDIYIGDGVYARFDGFGIWLKTPRENGPHEIYLEPAVWAELLRFGRNHGMPYLYADAEAHAKGNAT